MEGRDNYSVCLNEFESKVKESWKELQVERDFCDLTLACEDKYIEAHKVVIASFSPVIRNILKVKTSPHPVIYLRSVKYKELQSILSFMYQGEITVAQEDLSRFLEIAGDLKITGLAEAIKEESILKEENLLHITHQNISPSPNRFITNEENITLDNSEDKESDGPTDQYPPNTSENFHNNKNYDEGLIKLEKNQDQSLIAKSADQFMCKICDKTFLSHTGVRLHTKSVHEERQFNCDKCNYTVKQKGHLNRHIEVSHLGERHQCDKCEYKATRKDSLKVHIERIHEVGHYPCDQCDFEATSRIYLRRHLIKTHS